MLVELCVLERETVGLPNVALQVELVLPNQLEVKWKLKDLFSTPEEKETYYRRTLQVVDS